MSKELQKSAIIAGNASWFCLVCEKSLKFEHDAQFHIKRSMHAQNLSLYPHLDKFKDHHIRKVKAGYFCEFCNVLLLTAMRVDFHIAEERHKQNRGSMLLTPCSDHDSVFAFDDIEIEEQAWHGFMGVVCIICDKEVDDENLHKKDVSHILNLIQKPVIFGADDAIYRQTDDTTTQCLTCNVLLTLNAKADHFKDVDHLDRYTKRKLNMTTDYLEFDEEEPIKMNQAAINVSSNELKEENDTSDTKGNKRKVSKEVNGSKILSCVSIYRSNNIDVNFETDTAFCRKCCVDVQFDHAVIEKHIKNHTRTKQDQTAARYPTDMDRNTYNPKPEETESEDDEIITIPPYTSSDSDHSGSAATNEINLEINEEKCNFADAKLFAKENHLTHNEQNGNAFCRICQVRLPSSLKSMKEHVQGASHIKNVPKFEVQTKANTRSSLKKQNMKQFVCSVENLLRLYPEDCLVNRTYCINQFSFYFIIENSQGLRCLLCEKNINCRRPSPIQAHVDHPSHHSKMEVVPVITSVSSEFIREIRPDSFHCGFCNLVLSGWSNMENHIKCSDHATKKAIQTTRLRREIGVRVLSPFL